MYEEMYEETNTYPGVIQTNSNSPISPINRPTQPPEDHVDDQRPPVEETGGGKAEEGRLLGVTWGLLRLLRLLGY